MGINKELQQFEVDSDNDSVSEFTVGTDKEIYINNSQVQAATAVAGNVLTLADAVTGRLEFGNLAGNNIYKQPTAPISPLTNDVWSDTATGIVKYYDGVSWVNLNNDKAYFHATIAIGGQSLNTQPTKIVWDSVITDNESKWNATNNQYQIPRDGKYFIGSNFATNSTTNSVGNHSFTHVIYRNNVAFFYLTTYVYYSFGIGHLIGLRHNGGDVFDLLKDDLIDIRVNWGGWQASPSIVASSLTTQLTIIEL